jgi:type II secretory pathway pseudopilin PulG
MIIKSKVSASGHTSGGFTLIEIAMILVIVGLLVGMGAGMLGPLVKRNKLTDTRKTVREVYNSIVGYAMSNKTLPSALTALGVSTEDSYSNSILYYPAAGITGPNICTTQGTYLTVNDNGTAMNNVAFVVFSQGPNVCNQTGTASPFTIQDTGVTVACPQDANAGYDDIVLYLDINAVRERICNIFRIVTDTLPAGVEEAVYPSVVLEATDGTLAYTWSLSSGSLPPGLSLNAAGQITGTPVADGSYNFTVLVTEAEGRTASKSLVITIHPNDPDITTMFFHKGEESIAYSAALSATGGTGSYTWAVISGSLPPGLSLTGSTISGTPTTAGTYAFTLQITDGAGRQDTESLSITIDVTSGGGGGGGGGGSGGSGGSGGGIPPGGSNELWLGQQGGKIQACATTGTCTDYGDKGANIYDVAVFSSFLWIGQSNGVLKSCNSGGLCLEHGDQGSVISEMHTLGSDLWIAHNDGVLQSCDSSGVCTNRGDKGNNISAMTDFSTKLWIGQSDGRLKSCDTSGTCTDYGDKGRSIYVMREFNGKLWLGQNRGILKSCDASGACTNHGDKGQHIYAMAVFDNKLWIGQSDGKIRSCDTGGVCTDHGVKGRTIYAMEVYDSKLWIGHNRGVLQSCDTSGTCASQGDKGNHIRAMTFF